MAILHLKATSDLDTPLYEALHEGRIVLVGKKLCKRVLRQTKDGFYVKMGTKKYPKRRRYLSGGGTFVVTNGIASGTAEKYRPQYN